MPLQLETYKANRDAELIKLCARAVQASSPLPLIVLVTQSVLSIIHKLFGLPMRCMRTKVNLRRFLQMTSRYRRRGSIGQ